MTDRYVCTEDNPWTPDKGMGCHPEAELIDHYDAYYTNIEDSWDKYVCPNCCLVFRVTVSK